ncbi:hypothetical protein HD806DRAFT_503198 [Xylariaceae sp. AK1471]|nr:hypothetical protein HD806DRAFT_503198 [Xylariaceae sp. AK1471]
MVLSLNWTAVFGRTERWWRQDRQRSVDVSLSIITFLLCIVLLFWQENWLVGKGIEFLLVAATCISIARYLWGSGLVENPFNFGTIRLDAYVAGLAVCLPLAAFLLAVTSWYNRRDFHVRGRIIWILISMITGVLSLQSETSLKRFTSFIQDKVSYHTRLNLSFGSPAFSLLVVAIVELDNRLAEHRPSATSGVQWLAFIIAHLTAVDIPWILSSTTFTSEEPSYIRIPTIKTLDESTDGTKSPTPEETEALYPLNCEYGCESLWVRRLSLAWHAILSSLALLLVFSCVIGTPYEESNKRSWDLDIVIARYDEPIEQVVRTAQLALELPNIVGRKVRTIVYNKGVLNETELVANFPIQSRLMIRQLENVGREADTYLTHTLDSEQDWASHTLFLQAEPHDPSYLQARLRDYLVEETGFLSLSHVRNFCPSCDECNDHSGWSEDGKVLRDIFERANPDKPCQDISLTYRGQFVVSSRRMKQANQELLRDLRTRVIEDEHFGFTMERSWGTTFQCPTISERCPTLLSGWIGNHVAIEDCQCLDTI